MFAERWAQVEESGLSLLMVPEAAPRFRRCGGEEAWLAFHLAGRYAIDLPVPETIIAAHLLAAAGLDIPPGSLTIAPRVTGTVRRRTAPGALPAISRRCLGPPCRPCGRHFTARQRTLGHLRGNGSGLVAKLIIRIPADESRATAAFRRRSSGPRGLPGAGAGNARHRRADARGADRRCLPVRAGNFH